jgi:aspartyl-tRNA(Asn)/glutamyl-tRNA(Gln) amidotransferase subunit C
MPEGPAHLLSAEYIHKVAKLSRLAIRDADVEDYRVKLSAVLGYVEQLRAVDLSGVEPLVNIAHATSQGGEADNRLDADVPGPTLSNASFMKMTPAPDGGSMAPFLSIPKVLDEGGGA